MWKYHEAHSVCTALDVGGKTPFPPNSAPNGLCPLGHVPLPGSVTAAEQVVVRVTAHQLVAGKGGDTEQMLLSLHPHHKTTSLPTLRAGAGENTEAQRGLTT
jgi:hypothetical protein